MITIIIPAHNEAGVVGRSLQELLPGAEVGELEVIVVCNGCTDGTARVVSKFGPAVRCLETPVPSKTHALNLGDAVASGFPRFYVDADVVISMETVRRVSAVLKTGPFLAAAPRMAMEMKRSSWLVCAYYRVWQQLPYVKDGLIGVGMYALSREGRQRFGEFPPIIADDRYIRALFSEEERTVVPDCVSLVRAPETLAALIRIKTRSRLGGYEFERKFAELVGNEQKNYGQAIGKSLKNIGNWPALPVYLGVNLWCRLRAKKQRRRNLLNVWERDETSRARVMETGK